MTIKIEFPSDRKDIALAIGQALVSIGTGNAIVNSPAPSTAEQLADGTDVTGHQHPQPELTVDEQAVTNVYIEFFKTLDAEFAPSAADVLSDVHQQVSAQLGRGVDLEELRPFCTTGNFNNPGLMVTKVAAALGKTGSSANSADGSQEQSLQNSSTFAGSQSQATNTDQRVDTKGVAFNAEFCAKAADPFYKSGTRSGQWKKRKGVTDDAYDQWYADALMGSKVETDDGGAEEQGFNTGAVFGSSAVADPQIPATAGDLMAWVSEQQAAQRFTQQDVNDAMIRCNVGMDALFGGNADQEAIRRLYEELDAL